MIKAFIEDWRDKHNLTVQEAADLMGVHKDTLESWRQYRICPGPWRFYSLIWRGDPVVVDVARDILHLFGDKYDV